MLNFLRKCPREEPFHDSHITFPFSSSFSLFECPSSSSFSSLFLLFLFLRRCYYFCFSFNPFRHSSACCILNVHLEFRVRDVDVFEIEISWFMTRFNYSCTKLDAASRVVNVNSVTTARYTTPSIHNTVFHNLFTYSVYRPGTRWLGTSCFGHQRPGGLSIRKKLKLYSGFLFFFSNFKNIPMQR